MKKITDIRKIGKGLRYYLFVDDEFFGIYEAEILAKHKLKTGQEMPDEFFEDLKIENGNYACFNRGLAVLEKSMKTEKMLRDYLYQKGYPKSCIDYGVKKIKEYGYINDESFCENYIISYQNSKSKRKLKYDLLAKGVNENTIDSVLQNLFKDEDERENCFKFGQKYMKNKDFDIKTKQKFYNHLAGKGFNYDDISFVWSEIEKEKNSFH